jgi:outer membrane biosynthesis protein TonB
MGLFDFLKKNELEEPPKPAVDLTSADALPKPPQLMPVGEQQIPEVPEITDVPDSIPELELPEPPIEHEEQQGQPEQVITQPEHVVEQAEEPREKPLTGPVFLRMEQFREAMKGLHRSKEALRSANTHFDNITSIKNDQDKLFESLRLIVEDMERKLLYVDKTLFEGGNT